MPSILQGGPKPTAMAPPPAADPMGAAPQPGGMVDDGKHLVASIYEKPDVTYCTEDPTGQIQEFPDIQSALDSIGDPMGGGADQDMDAAAPSPKGEGGSDNSSDY